MAHNSIQGAQIAVEPVAISRFTMNNIAPKLQKCCTQKIAFNIISKMPKQPNFLYSHPSTLPNEALAEFYLSTTFGLRFIVNFVRIFNHQIGNCTLETLENNVKSKSFQADK